MPETREQIQRDAYVRGQQMKQWHRDQQRAVSHEALAVLAADFAQVSLFKSNQHFTGEAAHERAGLCERAFQEGYRSPLPSALAQTESTRFNDDEEPYDERKVNIMEQIEESTVQELTILQIMPALPGWAAVWSQSEEPAHGEPGYFTEPVVCWALVEATNGHRFVSAMAPDLETSELKLMLDQGNFLGYATPTYSLDWMKLASDKRTENRSPQP
ncbi:MAG: hypothetical protein ABI234_13080 [Ktedonobacteraceae bacterium]